MMKVGEDLYAEGTALREAARLEREKDGGLAHEGRKKQRKRKRKKLALRVSDPW